MCPRAALCIMDLHIQAGGNTVPTEGRSSPMNNAHFIENAQLSCFPVESADQQSVWLYVMIAPWHGKPYTRQASIHIVTIFRHCCLAPCKSVTNYGLLTEPKFYIVKSALTPIPTSNGHISETKRDSLDPLVPKFFSRRGLSPTLSWKWPSDTLSPSFGLFQS